MAKITLDDQASGRRVYVRGLLIEKMHGHVPAVHLLFLLPQQSYESMDSHCVCVAAPLLLTGHASIHFELL
jgi:hypothetical protein